MEKVKICSECKHSMQTGMRNTIYDGQLVEMTTKPTFVCTHDKGLESIDHVTGDLYFKSCTYMRLHDCSDAVLFEESFSIIKFVKNLFK